MHSHQCIDGKNVNNFQCVSISMLYTSDIRLLHTTKQMCLQNLGTLVRLDISFFFYHYYLETKLFHVCYYTYNWVGAIICKGHNNMIYICSFSTPNCQIPSENMTLVSYTYICFTCFHISSEMYEILVIPFIFLMYAIQCNLHNTFGPRWLMIKNIEARYLYNLYLTNSKAIYRNILY